MAKEIITLLVTGCLLLSSAAFAQYPDKPNLNAANLRGPVAQCTHEEYYIRDYHDKVDTFILIQTETKQFNNQGNLTGDTKYTTKYSGRPSEFYYYRYYCNSLLTESYTCNSDTSATNYDGPFQRHLDSAGQVVLQWYNALGCDSAVIDSFTYDKRGNQLEHLQKRRLYGSICAPNEPFISLATSRYNDKKQLIWEKKVRRLMPMIMIRQGM